MYGIAPAGDISVLYRHFVKQIVQHHAFISLQKSAQDIPCFVIHQVQRTTFSLFIMLAGSSHFKHGDPHFEETLCYIHTMSRIIFW